MLKTQEKIQSRYSGARLLVVALAVSGFFLLQWLFGNGHGWQSLFPLLGCLLELWIIARLGKGHLARPWLGLLLVFLGLTVLWQGLALGGLLALLAVFWVWKHLQQVYAGEIRPRFLMLGGICVALTGWCDFYAGLSLMLGMGFFSFLHCFLHEREERGVSYTKVSNQSVWLRWLRLWGLYWLLPLLITHLFGVAIIVGWGYKAELPSLFLDALTLPDRVAPGFGYFTTFHQEFIKTLQPTGSGAGGLLLWLLVSRTLKAVHLLLIGVLPIVGLLGMGYQVPNRFVYRLLQRPDEELLLFLIGGTALILATLGDSTSARIASQGTLAFLLGFLVLARFLRRRPQAERITRWTLWVFYGLLLIGYLT